MATAARWDLVQQARAAAELHDGHLRFTHRGGAVSSHLIIPVVVAG